MRTRQMGKADFDEIVRVIDTWWGGPTATLAHPVYFYELGQHARVMEHEGQLVGFLFGFVSDGDPPLGYVHLVGIHPRYRRQQVGRRLYASFEQACQRAQCRMMKAITPVGNKGSRAFHRALGWREQVIEDYAGPGRARVVFYKEIHRGK